MREPKGTRIGQENGKVKYAVSNPPPRSPLPEILEDYKLSLFDVDTKDEASSEVDYVSTIVVPAAATHVAVVLYVEPADPSVELRGIDVVIFYSIVDAALPDKSEK